MQKHNKMTNKNKNMAIGIVLVVMVILLFGSQLGLFASTENTVARSVTSTVNPGSTFTVTYTGSGTGTWGASIVDEVTGGCTFANGKTEYKNAVLSDGAPSASITTSVTAPTSGSCVFSGDYKFGEDAIKDMAYSTVTVSSGSTTVCTAGQTKCEGTIYYTCPSNAWSSQGQVDGKCGYTGTNGGTTDEPPTFNLDMVLFNLGGTAITLKLLLIGLGGLFIIKMVMGK